MMMNNIKNLTEWVRKTFKDDPKLEQQSFNVHAYTWTDKQEAKAVLEALGYVVTIENNDNSFKVVKPE